MFETRLTQPNTQVPLMPYAGELRTTIYHLVRPKPERAIKPERQRRRKTEPQ